MVTCSVTSIGRRQPAASHSLMAWS